MKKYTKRLQSYYNYNYLINPKRNMIIHKALLKYGYSEFRLDILEVGRAIATINAKILVKIIFVCFKLSCYSYNYIFITNIF